MEFSLRDLARGLSCGRRIGKTTQLAEAVKNLDGVMLCATEQHAKQVRQQYGIKAQNAGNPEKLRGLRGPFIADHFLIECVLLNASEYIEKLEKENAELQSKTKGF
jgi:hypothetical protein